MVTPSSNGVCWPAVLVARLAFFWSTFVQFCRTAQFLISGTDTGRWEEESQPAVRPTSSVTWRHRQLHFVKEYEWVGGRGVVLDPSLAPKHIASFCNSPLTHPTAPRVQAWRIRSIGWLDIFPSGWHEKDPIRRGCPKFWIIRTLADRWLSVYREKEDSAEICETLMKISAVRLSICTRKEIHLSTAPCSRVEELG